MTTTDKQKETQRTEDRAVVNIKMVANGFTVRVESKTFVFHDEEEVYKFIRVVFDNQRKAEQKRMQIPQIKG